MNLTSWNVARSQKCIIHGGQILVFAIELSAAVVYLGCTLWSRSARFWGQRRRVCVGSLNESKRVLEMVEQLKNCTYGDAPRHSSSRESCVACQSNSLHPRSEWRGPQLEWPRWEAVLRMVYGAQRIGHLYGDHRTLRWRRYV